MHFDKNSIILTISFCVEGARRAVRCRLLCFAAMMIRNNWHSMSDDGVFDQISAGTTTHSIFDKNSKATYISPCLPLSCIGLR